MRRLKMYVALATFVPAVALAAPQSSPEGQRPPDQGPREPAPPPPTEGAPSAMGEWTAGPGQLGVMVVQLTPQLRGYFGAPTDSGLLVAQVAPNSPASRAGIKVGDVITRVGNDKVESATQLRAAIDQAPANEKLAIEVQRDKKQKKLHAQIASSQEEPPQQPPPQPQN